MDDKIGSKSVLDSAVVGKAVDGKTVLLSVFDGKTGAMLIFDDTGTDLDVEAGAEEDVDDRTVLGGKYGTLVLTSVKQFEDKVLFSIVSHEISLKISCRFFLT